MTGFATTLRELTQKEPIIVWSCAIGAVGFALPLISYQVKESWGVKTEHMPKASQMFKGAGKAD